MNCSTDASAAANVSIAPKRSVQASPFRPSANAQVSVVESDRSQAKPSVITSMIGSPVASNEKAEWDDIWVSALGRIEADKIKTTEAKTHPAASKINRRG